MEDSPKLAVPRSEDLLDMSSLEYATYHGPNFNPHARGWFTTDPSSGEFRGEDAKTLKYLIMPDDVNDVCFDLMENQEIDEYNLPIKPSQNIDNLLRWIMENSALDESGKPISLNCNIVCYRHVLSDIMKLPHQRFEELCICAIRIGKIIYLCKFTTPWHDLDELKLETNPDHLNSCKQGLKFQHFMLSDDPDENPDKNTPFIRNKQDTCVVLQANIGNHSLLYASKNKGVPSAESIFDLNSASLFDLKTSMNNKFKSHQLMNWWSLCVTGKVQRMIVGLRGREGVVRTLEVLELQDMLHKAQELFESYKNNPSGIRRPRYGRGSRGRTYDPVNYHQDEPTPPQPSNVKLDVLSFGFMKEFLDFVCDTVKPSEDGPQVVYQFKWSNLHKNFVHTQKLTGDESIPFRFIPDWFYNWLNL